MTLFTVMEYVCHKLPRIYNTSRSFPHSWLITGWLTRRVSLVEWELPTLPEHLRSPLVFSGVRVTRSLVLYVCFVGRCLSFCTFSFGHCGVCSSIYGFWLPLWYLQTHLKVHILIYTTVDALYVTACFICILLQRSIFRWYFPEHLFILSH